MTAVGTAFSISLGLTNECDLRFADCYRPDMVVSRLPSREIAQIATSIPIRSMNLGVGENGLHPEYHAILGYFWARGIRPSITSNGPSIEAPSDEDGRPIRCVASLLPICPRRSHRDRLGARRRPGPPQALECLPDRRLRPVRPSMTPTFVLAIMAKAPRPSAVKTRLCPPLSPGVAKIPQPFDNF